MCLKVNLHYSILYNIIYTTNKSDLLDKDSRP